MSQASLPHHGSPIPALGYVFSTAVLRPWTQMTPLLWSPLYDAACLPCEGFPKTVASLRHSCVSAGERAIAMWLLLNAPIRFRLALQTSTQPRVLLLYSSISGPGLHLLRSTPATLLLHPNAILCVSPFTLQPATQYSQACLPHPDLAQLYLPHKIHPEDSASCVLSQDRQDGASGARGEVHSPAAPGPWVQLHQHTEAP